MHQQRYGARAEYREQERQRVKESLPLASAFKKLKSLTVEFEHYDPEGTTKNNCVRYEVNVKNAKSVFRFDCSNNECVGGDFDLTDQIADAVAAHKEVAKGEVVCQGWRSRTTINTVRCHNIFRYKLRLGY
ncbi:MAG TPA: hypothetical protein VLZ12_06365 [Verrucomicrobiae bacterium]|nr:hypothetical protein [Verrucomicrobiae bacterium]